jgi:hypothetical protein
MKLEGSMPHSQELSNNPYLELNQQFLELTSISLRYFLLLPSHSHLGLSKDLLPEGLTVKILNAHLPSSILVT